MAALLWPELRRPLVLSALDSQLTGGPPQDLVTQPGPPSPGLAQQPSGCRVNGLRGLR
jgi:hypothetical protein